MQHFVAHDGEHHRVEWWGGGTSATITFKESGKSCHLQGDEAADFVDAYAQHGPSGMLLDQYEANATDNTA